jgi:hypothetical protein
MRKVFGIALGVLLVALTVYALAPRSSALIDRSSPVVTITAVNGNIGVVTNKGSFVAFVSGGLPIVGHRYYARRFWLPIAPRGRQEAVLLVPDPLPGPR